MSFEDRLRELSRQPVAQPGFDTISRGADRRRRNRHIAVGIASLVVVAAGIGAVASLAGDDTAPDLIVVTDPTPSAVSVELPEIVVAAVAGEAGVQLVLPHPDDPVTMVETPAARAIHLAGPILVHQGATLAGGYPLRHEGSITIDRPGRTEMITAGSGETLRLHDADFVDGRPQALVSIETGSGSPEEFRSRLVLVDLGTGDRRELGIEGGWEAGIIDARLGPHVVAVQFPDRTAVDSLVGARRFDVPRDGERARAPVVVGDEVWLVEGRYQNDQLAPVLVIDRFALSSGRPTGSSSIELIGAEPEGEFCFAAAVIADEQLLCDTSIGPPLLIDPELGDTIELSPVGPGSIIPAREPDKMPAPPPADGATVACPPELVPTEGESRRFRADLDGDGELDTLAVDRPQAGPTVVSVCGSSLVVEPWDAGDMNRPLQVYVTDIEGDGISELLAGGATGTRAFVGNPVRVSGGELVGTPVGVEVGLGVSFGCVDTDGDGLRELVRIDHELRGGDTLDDARSLDWTRTVLLPGGTAGAVDTGTFDLPEDRTQAVVTRSGTCGDDVLIPIGVDAEIALVDEIIAFAADPARGLTLLTGPEGLRLGLGDQLYSTIAPGDLGDPGSWRLDVAEFEGWSGPFDVVETLARAGADRRDFVLTFGQHPRCVSPPRPAPAGLTGHLRVSVQPSGIDSCLQWFSVDLFVAADGTAAAVTLDLFAP